MSNPQNTPGLSPICHILTPVGMMGFGLDLELTRFHLGDLVATGIPTAIILDAGSTDSGPTKLALGDLSAPRTSYVRDLTSLLKLVDEFQVPLIFSSAGGDGTDEHVREMLTIIGEISDRPENSHYKLKTIAIYSGVDKALVRERFDAGAISGCGKAVPPLTAGDVDDVPRIVGQMGPEPFIDAMNAHPDFNVIVGGRSYDPAPYIAYASFKVEAPHPSAPRAADQEVEEMRRIMGGFTHMGKIMECGGHCAVPKSPGALATVYRDGTFDISPMTLTARCTPHSVAAHTLYEKTRPDLLHGPGGYLDLTHSTYKQLPDERTVRVRGGMFYFSREQGLPYQLKLEAAAVSGYRSMYMGSIHGPLLIQQTDKLLARVKGYVTQHHSHMPGKWDIGFHVFGKHAVVTDDDHEIFLIGEAHGDTQELATSIASLARVATIHGDYAGQKATSGNLAFGIGGKMQIELGPCTEFRIYHVMDLNEGEELLRTGEKGLFPFTISIIGKGEPRPNESVSLGPDPLTNGEKPRPKQVSGAGLTKDSSPRQPAANAPKTLNDISRVLRSKNAGPYEITFDVIFNDQETYDLVKTADFLTPPKVAEALGVPEGDIIWSGYFDPAQAWKATIPRARGGKWVASGGFLESDVHGSQMYLPLARMKLPESLAEKLGESLS